MSEMLCKIPESDIKTPDFKVFLNGKPVSYCEEKTLEYDDLRAARMIPLITQYQHMFIKQQSS